MQSYNLLESKIEFPKRYNSLWDTCTFILCKVITCILRRQIIISPLHCANNPYGLGIEFQGATFCRDIASRRMSLACCDHLIVLS